MAVTTDILATYRRPRAVIRAKLAQGVREDRALALLLGGCLMSFVAQWPALARAAHEHPEVPLDARLGGALMGTLFLLPLIGYGLAAISHLAARLAGGQGSAYGARLALFWTFLAISPLMLFHGLIAGFVGPGPGALAVGILVLVVFLTLWGILLHEAEKPC